nr:valine--tRNA ligase [Lachnospiraceae bacterium]
EGCSKAVNEVFINLHKKGLIYKGNRIINWCPVCKTSISDAEVEHEEQAGHFWHIKYPLIDENGKPSATEFLEFATTRPETMLGDSAVAINPEDKRYTHLKGRKVFLPFMERVLPIVEDSYVDMEFGTGVVKITPAHDPNDFEVGRRHDLPIINVLTDDARITEDYPKYAGMDRYEARKLIIKDLEEEGALIKTEPHAHNVGTCYRCHTTVEPRVSMQWFVSMQELAGPAIDAVKKGDTKFVPEHFDKTYYHWLENIKDWCISRQLWWGHRIPAFYCDSCSEMVVSEEDSCVCPKCGKPMRQDPDTLDTWFSSALWPFSTMGWPEKTEEMEYFYPTNVLVTGYDIILFWVIRMMFSGIKHAGDVPFDTVLIHGLVRDEQGRKMSKSLGNGIDPLEVIETYGADALRLTLVTGNAPGNDMRYSEKRIVASRNFANKVWNASRFIMMHLGDQTIVRPDDSAFETADKWIISRVNTVVKEVTYNMEKLELGVAVSKIYDFIWSEFCDWYIEIVKPRLFNKESEPESAMAAFYTLKKVLICALKLLHPYMPFVTEEIFTTIQSEEESIMVSDWPVYSEEDNFPEAEADINHIMELVKGVRTIRKDKEIPNSKHADVYVVSDKENVRNAFLNNTKAYKHMIYADNITATADKSLVPENVASGVISDAAFYIPLNDLINVEEEIKKLEKEKQRLEGELKRVNGMLSNPNFVNKAPEAKVNEEKAKLEKYAAMMETVEAELKNYKA